jgi:hypothetical protein
MRSGFDSLKSRNSSCAKADLLLDVHEVALFHALKLLSEVTVFP